MLATFYAGFLAILTTIAVHVFGEVIGGDPALLRSPGILVFIFTGLLGHYVYPRSSGDQLFFFAGLAVMAVWVFAGWVLGLVMIEQGAFGQLGDVQYAVVEYLIPFGFGVPA